MLERDERRRAASAKALRQANDSLERRVNERTAAWATANAELSAVVGREQEARAELETASRLKDEFLMTISHELRTPLNTIHGWVRMLQTGAVPQAQHARALDIIERNTRAQTRIVGDLLDVSRIITGKLEIEHAPVSLPQLVETVVAGVGPSAAAKQIAISTHVAADLPPIEGDPKRLYQVLNNTLANAVKFTPEGGRVELRCGLERGWIEEIDAPPTAEDPRRRYYTMTNFGDRLVRAEANRLANTVNTARSLGLLGGVS